MRESIRGWRFYDHFRSDADALARLILKASQRSQVWVVSHASRLIEALESHAGCNSIPLEMELSQTRVAGQGMLDEPPWHWPER